MLKYNTMRFGTDVFVLPDVPVEEPEDDPDTSPETTPGGGSDDSGGGGDSDDSDDPNAPKVAIYLGGKVYHFKLTLASA